MEKRENRYCSVCGKNTDHVVVLVRKESPFKEDKKRKRKEFLTGFLKGWAFGAFLASMDDFSRHCICEQCGTKTIED
ncbi:MULTISPECIES: hypothetical protein [Vibrio]|jgi:ribosomal protein L44E|uniref:LITAF domain-containing protein n=2 Tax=Vibrio TaxID=662 RepID=A0A241TAV8_9VIBR|nr:MULTISPECIES: hypothetical protein [Vibrio]ASI92361.1 hypothetical protein BSZ05_21395 [Vibrio mediterranei]AYV24464.1 hypothetical protein ECB94_24740 [Vibrio mediterranei]EDL52440.1 hypothetical protein VSAK1_15657 [Vibrio mediterranei AK1]MCF4172734.1 hypothetical protein [Vibrio sp. McD22-P3]MCG9628078.1 hypothetical protein [Vibrio mediterranei]